MLAIVVTNKALDIQDALASQMETPIKEPEH